MPRTIHAGLGVGLLTMTVALTGCASATGSAGSPAPFPRSATPAAAPPAPVTGIDSTGLLETARALEGRPYRYGGVDPVSGFDCSGFVWYVFAAHAVDLPRTAAGQFGVGRRVPASAIEPGDLVFFSTTAPGPTHVGIALDDHTIIHAPSTGTTVRVERFDTTYWLSRLTGVRRIGAGG